MTAPISSCDRLPPIYRKDSSLDPHRRVFNGSSQIANGLCASKTFSALIRSGNTILRVKPPISLHGHITIDDEGAVYVGSDQTIHLLRSDMREVKSYCASWPCGLYFTPKRGRKYFIVAVTEDAVSSRQIQASDVRPPWVLGNAVISKWKFIDSADNKTLTPPGGK